ncbi:hypothetical protein B0O99DRAFT_615134 [Bisporella sp. PMI_857]|nr:hypothetical protein B0O99DRAFT_615134 [Bisporella sp. PMI_857]
MGERARAWKRRPTMFVLSTLTLIAGDFICVAGMYVIITLIVRAYDSGFPEPFSC